MKNDWNTSSAQELNKNNSFFYLCFVFLRSGWAAAKTYPIKLALLIRREEVRHAPSRDFRCRERSIFSDWKSSSAQDMSKTVSFFIRVSFLDVLAPQRESQVFDRVFLAGIHPRPRT